MKCELKWIEDIPRIPEISVILSGMPACKQLFKGPKEAKYYWVVRNFEISI